MPENTRKIKLVGSSAMGFFSASFETDFGNHECERVKRAGIFGGGDYILECDQLPTIRPIRRIHLATSRGTLEYDIPERHQNIEYVEIQFE
jgi:hypothetical protein